MDYFQLVTMVAADEGEAIPEVAAVVQPTGLELKSPVMVITAPEDTSLPIPAGSVSLIVHVSAAVPAANAKLATSGVGFVNVGF